MSTSGRTDPSASGVTLRNQPSAQIRYFIGPGLIFLAASALIWPMLGRGVERFQFMPHVFCYLGNSTLISVNLISDLLIGISYVVISLTLVYLVRACKGAIPFHWMFLAFGTFIIACGGTHFMEAITLWHPVYWMSAYVKVVTAVASVATAIALPLVMPRILGSIESMRLSESRAVELAHANRDLNAADEKLRNWISYGVVSWPRQQRISAIGTGTWPRATSLVTRSGRLHGMVRGTFSGDLERLETVHPDDRERSMALVKDAIQNSHEYDVEYRTIRPDGSFYWIAGRGAVEYDSAGKPIRMMGMCMDISDRKRTEEA